MKTPKTTAALATLTEYQLLLIRMSGPMFAAEYIVQAHDCLERGQQAHAAGLVGRAIDAAKRRPFKRNVGLWRAALEELTVLTGAKVAPSEVHIHV
jgi:hypothetical protein